MRKAIWRKHVKMSIDFKDMLTKSQGQLEKSQGKVSKKLVNFVSKI